MEPAKDSKTKYINKLDTDKFAKMLDDPTQCYKFYWLDAILSLINMTDGEMTFDSLFNEMITSALYSVAKYHLRLGPVVNGVTVNQLERAVRILESDYEMLQSSTKNEIINIIKKNKDRLNNVKKVWPFMFHIDYFPLS